MPHSESRFSKRLVWASVTPTIWFTVASLTSLAVAQCPPPLTSPNEFLSRHYDYIIVGGGTAGLTVATRLSEEHGFSVGVLEAGYLHIPDPNISVPLYDNNPVFNPMYDWMMSTVPQSSTAGRSILAAPRGKILGGSSAINSMAWTRASLAEYAVWDDLGDYPGGWNWDGLLPYFMKSQTRQPNSSPGLPGFMTYFADNGFSGPINTSLNTVYSDIVPPYIESMNNLNISVNLSPLDGNSSGLWNTPVAVDRRTGTRADSAIGYYCPSATRSNLHVLSGATVSRIIFDSHAISTGLKASGVVFFSGESQYTVNATREIILSAGVLKTPQLLELSGIGNATLLEQVGVTPLINLPGVGENLQEHVFVSSDFELMDGYTTFGT
ncbi:glucose-methanol-choline oxidoreductase, partial [Hygrophoropsis aurantiaca]